MNPTLISTLVVLGCLFPSDAKPVHRGRVDIHGTDPDAEEPGEPANTLPSDFDLSEIPLTFAQARVLRRVRDDDEDELIDLVGTDDEFPEAEINEFDNDADTPVDVDDGDYTTDVDEGDTVVVDHDIDTAVFEDDGDDTEDDVRRKQ